MMSLPELYESLIAFQYLILFPIAMFEGPIATVVAGFLVAQGLMNIFLVTGIIIVADLAGDALYYAIGRWKGKFGLRFLGLSEERLTDLKEHFEENSGKTILLGKLAHGIGAVILFAAGVARVPFRKFLLFNTIGTIPKSFALISIGYFFGNSFVLIGKYFDLFGLVTLGIGLALLIAYLRIAKKIRKKEDL